MVARPLRSSNLLALALLLASLAPTYAQVSTDSGGGARTTAATNVKQPLGPLEVSTKSASRATTVPVKDMADSTRTTSGAVSSASASVGGGLTSPPPMTGSGSSSSSASSETHTSTTGGPDQRATSSHSIHVSTTSSDGGNLVHTFESHQNGNSPPEIVEEFHGAGEPSGEDYAEEEEEAGEAETGAHAASVVDLGNNAPWSHDYQLQPPKIIDHSADGLLSHQRQHHDSDDNDEEEDDDEDHHDKDDDDDDDEDDHHHKKYKSHHTTYVPRSPQLAAYPPVEHIDETYIDTSDPSDPKKVHYLKDVKAHVGPNGESYQHQESKTSNSLGANPNSHSYHHSSSSSSSSYVTSHSGSGGGNYKQYKPYLGVNHNHNHHGKINKHHNRVHHAKPYQHQVQSQHGHYEFNKFAPLPPLPSLPGIEPLFRLPPFPALPHAPAMPSPWLDVAQPSSRASYKRSLHPATVHHDAGRVHYGPDEAIKPAKLSRLEKRAENMKRRLAKLQAKRRERLERGQYSELEDIL